jgi:hypothetical protein
LDTVERGDMNIEPICQTAMEFLKGNVPMPSLGTVTNIGEICEIDWYEGAKHEKAGSIFVTIDDPRVVGFKRVK